MQSFLDFLEKCNKKIGENMIHTDQLKEKDFRIYLGMPMYGGMLCEATLHGLLEIQQWSMAKGVGLRFQSMGN